MLDTILNTGVAGVVRRDDLNSHGVYVVVGLILYLILYCIFISKM